jgi:N utilization substance protein B
MAVVDRNILRMAVYELLWVLDVPPKAVINEAIEIAKKFGTTESSRFINGVLDRILREHRATTA